MERQFLIILFLFLFVSCQTSSKILPTEVNNNLDIPLTNKEINATLIEDVPNDIWEYILNKSQQDSEIVINDQTLLFMNNHIKDVDKFNEYLNKSYYFIYYVVQ